MVIKIKLISRLIITCSKLVTELVKETSERQLWRRFGVSIVNFEYGLHRESVVDFEQINVDKWYGNFNYHFNCIYVTMTTFSILHLCFKIYFTFYYVFWKVKPKTLKKKKKLDLCFCNAGLLVNVIRYIFFPFSLIPKVLNKLELDLTWKCSLIVVIIAMVSQIYFQFTFNLHSIYFIYLSYLYSIYFTIEKTFTHNARTLPYSSHLDGPKISSI